MYKFSFFIDEVAETEEAPPNYESTNSENDRHIAEKNLRELQEKLKILEDIMGAQPEKSKKSDTIPEVEENNNEEGDSKSEKSEENSTVEPENNEEGGESDKEPEETPEVAPEIDRSNKPELSTESPESAQNVEIVEENRQNAAPEESEPEIPEVDRSNKPETEQTELEASIEKKEAEAFAKLQSE